MNNSDEIRVSIIMPTYNRGSWIRNAIDSIIKQNFKMWELIIIDNESTDNTKEVVSSFSHDKRIRYFYVKKSNDLAISDYLNFGIEQARGEYIARLDDDDQWYDPDKLIKQFNYLENNKEIIVVGGGAIMVDKSGNELYRFLKRENNSQIRNNALYANPFCHNTVLYRKKAVKDIGGYKKVRFVEDWELWLRLGKIGKFYNYQEYFLLYTNAGQNLSVSNQKLAAKTILSLIKQYRYDYPNYKKAFVLNFLQYSFAFIPFFIRKRVQNLLFYIKRNYF